MTSQPLSIRDLIVGLTVAALALALYMRTLVPFALPSDSGEFQVLVHQLGVAHTTGYSTYLLLGHLFEQVIPWGDVAYRVNLFSAMMAAVTVGLVYAAGVLLTQSRPAALVGALCLAVGFTFWSQAIIAEVYSTGMAFTAGVLLCVLWWERTGSRWAIGLAAVLGGAGLGAHGSLALLGLAVVLYLLLNVRRWREWLLPALGGAALGLLLYAGGMLLVDLNRAPADIFNAAYTASRSKWGLREHDVEDTFVRAWFLMSAGQWRSAMFTNPAENTWPGILAYFHALPREVSLTAQILALVGLLFLFARRWRTALFLLAALVVPLFVYVNYNVGDRYVFFMPTYVIWSLLAAAGVGAAVRLIGRWAGSAVQAGAAAAVAFLCVWPLLAPRWDAVRSRDIPFLNERQYLVNRDTANTARIASLVAGALEPNAILFTDWHWLYPYYYAAHIEQGKTGMQFIETYPRAEEPGLAGSVIDFVAANIDSRPIYFQDNDLALVRAGYLLRMEQVGPMRMYRVEKAQ